MKKALLILLTLMIGFMGCEKKKTTILQFDTTYGTFKVKMYDDKVPQTVKRIKQLASDGFYSNIVFHRVIKNFMNQTGDPTGTGMGGSGTKIPDEFPAGLEFNKPGIVGMANAGPNTGDSQFFIVVQPTPWLNGKQTIFGEVFEGMDVITKINEAPTGAQDRPITEIKILKVTVTEQEEK